MQLRAPGARVLGSLVEKELSTPDQYPLTLKALTAACNQVSNRDPVVSYDESTVMSTLNTLKEQRLIRFVLPSHGRTAVRYRHVLDEALGLDTRQCALLAVLLLRGPQTIGELRARTDRMAQFDSLDEVEHELQFLAAAAEPLAASQGRRPGQKEERWITPLVVPSHPGSPDAAPIDSDPVLVTEPHGAVQGAPHGAVQGTVEDAADQADPVLALRTDIAALRSEVHAIRRDLDSLRTSLGG